MTLLDRDLQLGNRYRLTDRIAVGGMGEVWRAEDSVLHRTVAVKVLRSELTSDPTFLERFRGEARLTASLSHPGIASVFDYGEAELAGSAGPDTAYLVMELVEGQALSAIIRRQRRLPVGRTLDLVRQAGSALEVAHRAGMVHRDIKPGNLLVRPDGVVKVTDFGIARAADSVPLTRSGTVVGTAQYLSPEQAGGRPVTPASDVYSLGLVAYECLAGRVPFVADNPLTVALMQVREAPPALPGDIPAPVRALVGRAIAKDPRQRFATGGALAEAARALYDSRSEEPTTVLTGPPGGRPGAGHRGGAIPGGPAAGGPAAGGPAARRGRGDLGPAGTQVLRRPPPPAPPAPGAPVRSGRPAGSRWPLWLAGAAVLGIVLVWLAAVLLPPSSTGGGSGETSTPTGTGSQPSATVSAQPTTTTSPMVTVDAGTLVGNPVDVVVAQLREKGLRPTVRLAPPGTQGAPGTVVSVEPTGELAPNTEVTVVAVPEPGRGKKKKDD